MQLLNMPQGLQEWTFGAHNSFLTMLHNLGALGSSLYLALSIVIARLSISNLCLRLGPGTPNLAAFCLQTASLSLLSCLPIADFPLEVSSGLVGFYVTGFVSFRPKIFEQPT